LGNKTTRTTAGEGSNLVSQVGGSNGEGTSIVTRAVGSRAGGTRVTSREDGKDVGGSPGIDVGKIPGITLTTTPGVVDDVGLLGAGRSVGAGNEFSRGGQIEGGAGRGGTTLGSDPLGTVGNTNTGGRGTSNGTHGVSSVTVVVRGSGESATGVEPGVSTTTVVSGESSVSSADTSVNTSNNNTLASVTTSPDIGSTDEGDVLFGESGVVVLENNGQVQLSFTVATDDFDIFTGSKFFNEALVSLGDVDSIDDPETLEFNTTGGQEADQGLLGLGSESGENVVTGSSTAFSVDGVDAVEVSITPDFDENAGGGDTFLGQSVDDHFINNTTVVAGVVSHGGGGNSQSAG